MSLLAGIGSPKLLGSQTDFSGGMRLDISPETLRANEYSLLLEGRLDQYGFPENKDGGTQKIHATALNPIGTVAGYSWERTATVTEQLTITGGKLYTTTSLALPVTWTDRGGTFNNTIGKVSIIGFRDGSADVAYIADGGLLNKWNGAAATLTENIAGTPSVSYLAVYNQRLFGVTGDDDTLYWSALNNGDTLGISASGGGSAIIRAAGRSPIVGLAVIGSSLLLLHRTSISRFTGWSQDDISIQTGTAGHSSDLGMIKTSYPVVVDNVGYILSDRGIYRLTEYDAVHISRGQDNFVQGSGLLELGGMQPAHLRPRKEILFPVNGNACLLYNYSFNKFVSKWFIAGASESSSRCLWLARTGITPGDFMVLSGHDDGFIRNIESTIAANNVNSDGTGGTLINSQFLGPRINFGSKKEKSLRWLYLRVKSADSGGNAGGNVLFVRDDGGNVAPLNSFFDGAASNAISEFRFPLGLRSRGVQLLMTNMLNCKILSYEFEAREIGRRL